MLRLWVAYAGDQTVWNAIETVCIIAFSIEYVLRLFGSPDRVRFVKGALNIVDLIAILPFYIELAVSATEEGGVAGLAVFRVIRLARVFRLFKLGRYSDGLKTFANTMAKSTRPLAMLVFFMCIAIVLFSSAIHYCERGEWDEVNRVWWIDVEGETFQMVTLCSGSVNMTLAATGVAGSALSKQWSVEYPSNLIMAGDPVVTADVTGSVTGNATMQNVSGSMANVTMLWSEEFANLPPIDGSSPKAVEETAGHMLREALSQEMLAGATQYRAGLPASATAIGVAVAGTVTASCRQLGCTACPEGMQSKFESIPASFYWASVTMTTVGYGDVFPLTTAGQLVASITMMFGILILALPITVIGSNFATEYEEYLRRQKIDDEYRQRVKFEAQRASESVDLNLGVAAGMAGGPESAGDEAVHAYIEGVLKSRVGQPLTVFQEMDWVRQCLSLSSHRISPPFTVVLLQVAHRARNELRAAIELMVRQQRDTLVLKLHGIVRRYEKERKKSEKHGVLPTNDEP